jgi:hypothetical protein
VAIVVLDASVVNALLEVLVDPWRRGPEAEIG